jgi:AcrR family transcriptional regulator
MDQRIDRSCTALKQALSKLLLTRSYASITVEDIAQCAGVSRSTFYMHFKDKEALLKRSISGRMVALSRLALEGAPAASLVPSLDHYVWAGETAITMLSGDMHAIVGATLAAEIERHLRARSLHRPGRLRVPVALLSAMLADALMAAVRAWLMSSRRMSADDFASALARQVSALIHASMAGAMSNAEADDTSTA